MKLLRLTFIPMLLLVCSSYGKGKNPPELGIGIGGARNAYWGHQPGHGAGLRVTYEAGIRNFGKGTMFLGGIGAVTRTSGYSNWNKAYYGRYKYEWTAVELGARIGYTYPVSREFNVYGGGVAAIGFVSSTETYIDGPVYTGQGFHGTIPMFGLFLGCDYSLASDLRIFAEASSDILYFTAGVKFGL